MKRESAYRHKSKSYSKIFTKIIFGAFILLFIFLIRNQIMYSKFLGNNWRTNIIFHSTPALFVSFPKVDGDETLIFTVPDNLLVQVSNGYGNYQINRIWKLAVLEKKPDLYVNTLANFFDTYISGQIGENVPIILNEDINSIISKLRQKYNLIGISSSELSNLSIFDRFIFWIKLNQFKIDKIQYHDLNKLNVLSDLVLPDGSEVKNININSWNKFLSDKFIDAQIRQSNLSIEVINATQVGGIGQKFTSMLNNLGARVISTANSDQKIDNCQIILKPVLRSVKIIKILQSEFGCDLKYTQEQESMDIVVILGKYFGDYLQPFVE